MRKYTSTKVFVATPCTQQWEQMLLKSNGKYCDHCQKVVVDFTTMSDNDIVAHLNTNKKSCGRFFEDQLNRELLPTKRQSFIQFRKKILQAAAVISAIFSIKNSFAIKNKKLFAVEQTSTSGYGLAAEIISDSLLISGRIVDNHGHPLYNAEILLNENIIAKTNKDGFYSFIAPPEPKSHLISFVYPELVNAIRNYHPAMGTTSFDISLFPASKYQRIIMGGISSGEHIDFSSFKINSNFKTKLTNEDINKLAELAVRLKSNPNVVIEIIAAGKTPMEINIAKAWQKTIKHHLINNEGIAEERLKITIAPYTVLLKNIIEFKNCTKE